MAGRMGGFDSETGNAKLRSGKVSRASQRATLIPWTPGPQTRAQRIKRALIG